MSLRPQSPLPPVPEDTARVAQIAFRRGNPYLLLRTRLGTIFADTEFADLYPARPARLRTLAPGPRHPPAVPRGPERPPGRRGSPCPDRLEVPARPRPRRSGLRLQRPVRVPRPAAATRGHR